MFVSVIRNVLQIFVKPVQSLKMADLSFFWYLENIDDQGTKY